MTDETQTGATDFDAAAAESSPKTMQIGDRTVQFPAELPPGVAAAAQMERVDLIYRILAQGDDDLLEHLILHMSEADFQAVGELYGVSIPESGASAGSSSTDGV